MNSYPCFALPDIRAALQRNARKYTEHLSSLLTGTITDIPLVCQIPREGDPQALIRFRGENRESRTIALGNGLRIYVFQRILPNPDDSRKVTTAEYQYSYGFGEPYKEKWIARWDYVPEEEEKPEYSYPVAHVHFNGTSSGYGEFGGKDKPLHKLHFPTKRIALENFLEHLVVELNVPAKGGERKALDLFRDSYEGFHEKRTK